MRASFWANRTGARLPFGLPGIRRPFKEIVMPKEKLIKPTGKGSKRPKGKQSPAAAGTPSTVAPSKK